MLAARTKPITVYILLLLTLFLVPMLDSLGLFLFLNLSQLLFGQDECKHATPLVELGENRTPRPQRGVLSLYHHVKPFQPYTMVSPSDFLCQGG